MSRSTSLKSSPKCNPWLLAIGLVVVFAVPLIWWWCALLYPANPGACHSILVCLLMWTFILFRLCDGLLGTHHWTSPRMIGAVLLLTGIIGGILSATPVQLEWFHHPALWIATGYTLFELCGLILCWGILYGFLQHQHYRLGIRFTLPDGMPLSLAKRHHRLLEKLLLGLACMLVVAAVLLPASEIAWLKGLFVSGLLLWGVLVLPVTPIKRHIILPLVSLAVLMGIHCLTLLDGALVLLAWYWCVTSCQVEAPRWLKPALPTVALIGVFLHLATQPDTLPGESWMHWETLALLGVAGCWFALMAMIRSLFSPQPAWLFLVTLSILLIPALANPTQLGIAIAWIAGSFGAWWGWTAMMGMLDTQRDKTTWRFSFKEKLYR